jgi:hypothetical protein
MPTVRRPTVCPSPAILGRAGGAIRRTASWPVSGLRRARLAEVLDPAVIGIADFRAKRLAPAARPVAAEPPA